MPGRKVKHAPVEALLRAAASTADRILFTWNALPVEVIGFLALLPILDPISDLAVLNQLLSHTYYFAALMLLAILLMHWRFCTLYAALIPAATISSAATLYTPFMLLPNWGCIVGEEVSEEDLCAAYEEARTAPRASLTFAAPAKQPTVPAVPLLFKLPKLVLPTPPPSPPSPALPARPAPLVGKGAAAVEVPPLAASRAAPAPASLAATSATSATTEMLASLAP